jgi:hypothetical protein
MDNGAVLALGGVAVLGLVGVASAGWRGQWQGGIELPFFGAKGGVQSQVRLGGKKKGSSNLKWMQFRAKAARWRPTYSTQVRLTSNQMAWAWNLHKQDPSLDLPTIFEWASRVNVKAKKKGRKKRKKR